MLSTLDIIRKLKNGIRNTFCFVSFSKFGTYSSHTVQNRMSSGPRSFAFFNEKRTAGPKWGILSTLDPIKVEESFYLYLLIILAFS